MDTYYMHPQYTKWREINKNMNAAEIEMYCLCENHAEVLTEMLFARLNIK